MARKPFQTWAKEVWEEFAEQLHGEFFSNLNWRDDRIQAEVDAFPVTIDIHTDEGYPDEHVYTRIRAPYINADGFRFKLYHEGVFEKIAKVLSVKDAPHLSLQDIQLGDPIVDKMFVIQGSNVSEVKQLLQTPTILHLLKTEPELRAEVRHSGGWFEQHYPEGVDELVIEVEGRVAERKRLSRLVFLFTEILHRLCQIGAAYEDNPNILFHEEVLQ